MPNGNSTAGTQQINKDIVAKRIKLGRRRAGLALDEVGKSLGISAEMVTAMENGAQDPSLPQLEILALIFNMKVVDFWDESAEEEEKPYPTLDAMALRRRIIGVLLRQARGEAGHSEDEIAQLLNVPVAQVTSYEMGEADIPLSQLVTLTEHYNLTVLHFLDNAYALTDEKLNSQLTLLNQLVEFSQLPEDTREFLANPANLLYLNIAMRLSELSVDTLRGLAEGLLEVTY